MYMGIISYMILHDILCALCLKNIRPYILSYEDNLQFFLLKRIEGFTRVFKLYKIN